MGLTELALFGGVLYSLKDNATLRSSARNRFLRAAHLSVLGLIIIYEKTTTTITLGLEIVLSLQTYS